MSPDYFLHRLTLAEALDYIKLAELLTSIMVELEVMVMDIVEHLII